MIMYSSNVGYAQIFRCSVPFVSLDLCGYSDTQDPLDINVAFQWFSKERQYMNKLKVHRSFHFSYTHFLKQSLHTHR